MLLPLNRKILTRLRHQWLIHKIKLLFLADIKNYFKLMFGVLPLDFMSPNTVLILNSPEFPNTMLKKEKLYNCKFQSCLHFSFSLRCTSLCNHKSNLRHLNAKILQPVFLTSVYTEIQTQVWSHLTASFKYENFPHFHVFFLVREIFTVKPSHCGLFYFGLTVILTLKKQTRDKSGLNRSDRLPLPFSTG